MSYNDRCDINILGNYILKPPHKYLSIFLILFFLSMPSSVGAGKCNGVCPPTKKIIEKATARVDDSWFFGASITAYYLVAEDGSVCRVTVGEYHKVKIGDKFMPKWKGHICRQKCPWCKWN